MTQAFQSLDAENESEQISLHTFRLEVLLYLELDDVVCSLQMVMITFEVLTVL